MPLVTRQAIAATSALLGALLLGGVSQAFLWHWESDGLALVTSSQFMWVLLTFGVSWGWAEGRLRHGAAAGGLTGLALIASYYAMQWAAGGRHSAVAQFTKTGGVAWTLATVGGGATIGLCGALAGMPARRHPRLKALGMTTPGVLVAAGPPLWIAAVGDDLGRSRLMPAVAVFLVVGAALVVAAFRACGVRASAQALVLSIGIGAAALAGLLVLQTRGGLYVTF